MNKDYIYIDGNAIISNENGDKKVVKYHDNLDEELVQENVIETIESKISKIEEEIKSHEKYGVKHFFPAFLSTAVFGCTILSYGICYLFTGINPFTYVDNATNLNAALTMTLYTAPLMIPFGALMDAGIYSKYKQGKNRINGIDSALDYLKKQLEIEKQKLEDLRMSNEHTQELKKFSIVEVDDKQDLEDLQKYETLYYDLAYNASMYDRLYRKGKLDEKLRRYYTPEDIEKAEEYLEEKGPTLTKNK